MASHGRMNGFPTLLLFSHNIGTLPFFTAFYVFGAHSRWCCPYPRDGTIVADQNYTDSIRLEMVKTVALVCWLVALGAAEYKDRAALDRIVQDKMVVDRAALDRVVVGRVERDRVVVVDTIVVEHFC